MNVTVGAIMLALGVGIILWTNQRAFNRRNVAGVQEFNSYGHALLIRTLELIGRLVAWLLMLVGAGSLFVYFMTGRG